MIAQVDLRVPHGAHVTAPHEDATQLRVTNIEKMIVPGELDV